MHTPLYHLDELTVSGSGYTDTDGVQWILMEEVGFWDSPELRTDIAERVNAPGSYMGASYFGHRVITMTVRAYAPDPVAMRRAWAWLLGMGAGPLEAMTLSCDAEIGTLTAEVRRDAEWTTTPVRALGTYAFEAEMQLVAPDYRRYSAQWYRSLTGLPAPDENTGLDFAAPGLDFSDPGLDFGLTQAGFLQLTNAGTAPSYPRLTLTGRLVHPVITASMGGQAWQMRYNATLTERQTLVIDPRVPSVLLGGTANRRYQLNPASFAAFAIPAAGRSQPGYLAVGLTHEGPQTDSGTLRADYRDAWI